MLKRLFTSNARIKLLSLFLLNPTEEYFVRELTRKLDEQINSVRRELENLKKLGLLKCKSRNRKKYYSVNTNFTLFAELELIFRKTQGINTDISKKIIKCGEVHFIALTGIFVDKTSSTPIDILIAGDIDRNRLEEILHKESSFSKPVRYSIMSRNDFIYRWKFNDKFIHDIINDPETIISINKLEKELKK